MTRGRKPLPRAEAQRRGTAQHNANRFLGRAEAPAATEPPIAPEWLTPAGAAWWRANVPLVIAARSGAEPDSTALGNLANLIGALAQCWRAGDVPPAAHLAEARRMAEAFGIAGAKSRPGGPQGGRSRSGAGAPLRDGSNPFSVNGWRPGGQNGR